MIAHLRSKSFGIEAERGASDDRQICTAAEEPKEPKKGFKSEAAEAVLSNLYSARTCRLLCATLA